MSEYELHFPDDFDDFYEFEVTARGYFACVTIVSSGRTFRPEFYDPVRLSQSVRDYIGIDGFFAAHSIIVVESVTRDNIERAVEKLARSDFGSLTPEC